MKRIWILKMMGKSGPPDEAARSLCVGQNAQKTPPILYYIAENKETTKIPIYNHSEICYILFNLLNKLKDMSET